MDNDLSIKEGQPLTKSMIDSTKHSKTDFITPEYTNPIQLKRWNKEKNEFMTAKGEEIEIPYNSKSFIIGTDFYFPHIKSLSFERILSKEEIYNNGDFYEFYEKYSNIYK